MSVRYLNSAKKRLGDYLVERRVIPREVVEQVVQEQRKFFAEAATQPT